MTALAFVLLGAGCPTRPVTPLARPGAGTAELSPSAILANPAAFGGREVTVVGVVAPCDLGCTKMFCPPPECCNTCQGGLGLADSPPVGRSVSCAWRPQPSAEPAGIPLAEGTCGGRECEIRCRPLDLGKRYRVVGKLEPSPAGAGEQSRLALRVTRVEAVAP
jgi:hypothetical protein